MSFHWKNFHYLRESLTQMRFRYQFLLCFLLSVILSGELNAQSVWTIDTVFENRSLELKTSYFTAYTIQVKSDTFPLIINAKKQQLITKDPHVQVEGAQSNLIVDSDSIIRLVAGEDISVSIVFQFVPELSINQAKGNRRSLCNPPEMVKPEVWRQGLANPKPNPSVTNMQHAIVHHSASGNGNSNYTQLVRNYYVQHTQVNGWDDIGYNYLIAANGTIYIGRDRQALSVAQYHIKGAHFCSKNSGTVGVCLIGDYSATKPTDTSLQSLNSLLSYIFFEENISAISSSIHPSGGLDSLEHIAGHRQGCTTQCPGDSVWNRMDELRKNVEEERLLCNETLSVGHTKESLNRSIEVSSKMVANHTNELLKIYDISSKLILSVPAGKTMNCNLRSGNLYLFHQAESNQSQLILIH